MTLRAFAITALFLTLAATAAAREPNRWVLRAAAGTSVSEGRGSALEAQLIAEVKPDLWLGLESGVSRMTLAPVTTGYYPGPIALGAGRTIASLTDGITRDRVFFAGPVVRWGSSVYAVASYGVADVRDASGTAYLQGGSVGIGVGGTGRWQPSAELRRRFVTDAPPFGARRATASGDAWTMTVGLHLR